MAMKEHGLGGVSGRQAGSDRTDPLKFWVMILTVRGGKRMRLRYQTSARDEWTLGATCSDMARERRVAIM